MASTTQDKTNETPFLLKALPFVAGAGGFLYSFKYKKYSYKKSAGVSAALFLLAATPWALKSFGSGKTSSLGSSATGGAAPAISVPGTGSSSTLTEGENMASHLNSMDSVGRKYAIDYIITQEANMDASKKYYTGAIPSVDQRKKAFNTLANDELKVLYCMYRFIEDRQNIYKKYGSVSTGDASARQVAKEMYGIDLSGVDNVENTASIAITKTLTALNLK